MRVSTLRPRCRAARSSAAAALLLALALAAPPALARPAPQPNFIVILADDLGWRDLGCQGSAFYQTPHLDRLAREGVRFTQAYAACTVCSPTRASLLTGQYPARLRLTDWIPGHVRPDAPLRVPDWTQQLPAAASTLPEALRALNYRSASIGKWHLGGIGSSPTDHGFDLNLAGTDRGQPPSYFSPYRIATLPDGPPGEFLTDREASEAERWIAAQGDRPFVLYLPHHAVHTPLMGKAEVIEKYRCRVTAGVAQTNALYAALVESVDDSVGRLQSALERLGLSDRTVIVFTSDNGGLVLGGVTSNQPLRAGKGSPYEGGVRVPLLVKWPGVTRPGTVCRTPVITPDLYPTVLEIAGLDARAGGNPIDGESLVPLLRGGKRLRRDALFWHYPHYHPGGATPYSAIRQGNFKLIEFFEDRRLELYDLERDAGESRNLAQEQTSKARALQRRLAQWRQEVGAQLPLPNTRR